MKKLLSFFFALLALPALAQTGSVTLSGLPSATTLTGSEIVLGTQGGASVKIGLPGIKTYVLNGLPAVSLSGNYADLLSNPTLGTLSSLTVTGTASSGYTVISGGDGTYHWGAASGATVTIGSNATGIMTFSSNVLNFANPVNGANGLVLLDGSGAIPLGQLGNYIGVSGGVQGYDANTTLLGNAVTGSGSLVKSVSPTLTGTVTINALLAGSAFGTGAVDALAHGINGADGFISYNYVTSYYTPTASLGTLALATITGTASSSTYLRGDNTWASPVTPWEYKSSSFTAVAGHKYQVDTTSGTVTVTAPGSPSDMDSFEVQDLALKFGVHALLVTTTGSVTINGTVTTYTDAVIGDKLNCTYTTTGTLGWSIK